MVRGTVHFLPGYASSNIEVVGNNLVIEVSNPAKENPAIVDAITAVGGCIQFVTDVSPTLEDVYLKLVRS